jgi:hypothetical protein
MLQTLPTVQLVYGVDNIKMNATPAWSSTRSSWCVGVYREGCILVCESAHTYMVATGMMKQFENIFGSPRSLRHAVLLYLPAGGVPTTRTLQLRAKLQWSTCRHLDKGMQRHLHSQCRCVRTARCLKEKNPLSIHVQHYTFMNTCAAASPPTATPAVQSKIGFKMKAAVSPLHQTCTLDELCTRCFTAADGIYCPFSSF